MTMGGVNERGYRFGKPAEARIPLTEEVLGPEDSAALGSVAYDDSDTSAGRQLVVVP